MKKLLSLTLFSCAALGLLYSCSGIFKPKPLVIFDAEMTTDDLYSMNMLIKSDKANVKSVTVSGSDQFHDDGGPQDACDMLVLSDADKVPVSQFFPPTFCSQRKDFSRVWDTILSDKHLPQLPRSKKRPNPVSGPELMYKTLKENKGKQFTIFSFGELQNVAHLISSYPDVRSSISQIVILGGSLHFTESAYIPKTQRWKESSVFNQFSDPCAANILFTSNIPILLIPLDVTNNIPLNNVILEKYGKTPRSAAAKYAYAIINSRLKNQKNDMFTPFWDMVAIGCVIKPDLFNFSEIKLKVITEGEKIGSIEPSKDGTNVKICTYVNPKNFYRWFFNLLSM